MTSTTAGGLNLLLQQSQIDWAVPETSISCALDDPLEIPRSYLVDTLVQLLPEHSDNARIAVQLTKDIYEGDLGIVVPKLRIGHELEHVAAELIERFPESRLLTPPFPEGVLIRCFFDQDTLPRWLLPYILDRGPQYGLRLVPPDQDQQTGRIRRVVVEFSSPNIVAEFSGKHLRSTILGAQISNLYRAFGWDVISLNYLGDWGKPIGLLGAGFERFGSLQALDSNGIEHLREVYRKTAKLFEPELIASRKARDSDGSAQAAQIESSGLFASRNAFFNRLVHCESQATEFAKRLRGLSIDQYVKHYDRLGIHFNKYDGESQILRGTKDEVIDILRSNGVLTEDQNNKYIDFRKHGSGHGVGIITDRDGNDTYLLRDIAAVLERYRTYAFDKMIYVVASDAHTTHFVRLMKVLQLMGMANIAEKLQHITFHEDSLAPRETSGEQSLGSILDLCGNWFEDKVRGEPRWSTQFGELPRDDLSRVMLFACTALPKRSASLRIDLQAITPEYGTGLRLLEAYQSLALVDTLLLDRSTPPSKGFKLSGFHRELDEYEVDLMRLLARFPSTMDHAYRNAEPSILMSYAMGVVTTLDHALVERPVATVKDETQRQLLQATRIVIGNSMKVLGIPLSIASTKAHEPVSEIVYMTLDKQAGMTTSFSAEERDDESDSNSVFSLGGSSTTSLTSYQPDDVSFPALQYLASMLTANDRLRKLCMIAIESEQIGVLRFQRRLKRLLQTYGAELIQEISPDMTGARVASNLIARKARYIADRIAGACYTVSVEGELLLPKTRADTALQMENYLKRLAEQPPVGIDDEDQLHNSEEQDREFSDDDEFKLSFDLGGDDSDASSEEENEDLDEKTLSQLPHLSAVESFLIDSNAFGTLLTNLEGFINPSWHFKLQSMVRGEVKQRQRYGVGDLHLRQLSSVAAELDEADVSTLEAYDHYNQSLVENIQCRVEDMTKHRWNWWPLNEPRRLSTKDCGYVQWNCHCGERRWEPLPLKVIKKMSALISQERSKRLQQGRAMGSNHGAPAASQQSPAPSRPSLNHVIVSPPAALAKASSASVAQDHALPVSAPLHVQQRNDVLQRRSQHIFLAVSRADQLHLAQISARNLHDDSFFAALKREYIAKRGMFRYLFSPWEYSRCDFVKLEKIEDHTHIAHGQGMPESNDKQYEFVPKLRSASDPMPPIHPHIFWHRFHKCFQGGGKGHAHLFGLFRNCRKRCRENVESLRKIPKRDRKVIEEGDAHETYWGLQAKDKHLNFVKLTLYHIMVLSGPFAFWIYWVKQHPNDIQNAAVPLTTVLGSLGLISSFWMIVITSQ